ncbi:3-hydroxyacyl-CoA dehydrogenase [Pandoraea pneumonica]|uniref:enoyl-CoA hydratase n=1 Tax=Pandoraea pneumonica TaxID=2508299 RepID=A0A5E4SF50_9BURK|nr:enoyl-CoA hydratase-related protein [Pandoraea pneumonica]VVD73925.1 3-hydroxyacyl-CoA dehydrogenase [Pandoraea pneumonica]
MSDGNQRQGRTLAPATALAPVTTEKRGRVAVFHVAHPPVNAFSHGVRAGLMAALQAALADSHVDVMVIACGGRTFIAGADIREFGRPMLPPLAGDVIESIAASPKPVVAALHGTALGGGFELAMACQFRVAAVTTRIGLPEVKLGILPGSGGTQRLPRLIGVPAALRMIVTGEPIDANRAFELGAVDAVVEGHLIDDAVRFAEQVVARGTPPKLQNDAPVACTDPEVFEKAEADVRRERPGVEAPLACIRAVRFACEMPLADGLRAEYALCMTLMNSAQSRALRHIFAAERQAMKIDGLPSDPASWPVRQIASVGIVGEGTTANATAAAIIKAGVPVILLGRNDAITALHDCDLVIESIEDELEQTQALFRRFDAICKPGAMLVSGTSSLNIERLADATARPANVAGLHVVTPAKGRRLVEVIRTSATDKAVVATLMQFAKRLGKAPIVSRAGDGSIATRMLAAATNAEISARASSPYREVSDEDIQSRCLLAIVNEGKRLLDEGTAVRASDIDVAAVYGLGFPAHLGGPMYHADTLKQG